MRRLGVLLLLFSAFALPGDRPVWGRNRPLKMEHLKLEFSFDLKKRQVKGQPRAMFGIATRTPSGT